MKRNASTTLCLVLALASSASLPVFGTPVYGTDASGELTGTRTETSGIVTIGNYTTDGRTQSLSWNIMSLGGGLWSYSYTFSNFSRPGISHFILDLTDDCVEPGDARCVVGPAGELVFGGFGPAPSNPSFPSGASIVGVKFDFGASSYSFTSNRAPVYGDFYTKGGSANGNLLGVAYNAGLANHSSTNIAAFIARPDGLGSEVPEPSTMLLLAGGLIAIGAARRRRSCS